MKKLIIILSLFSFLLPLSANAQLDIQVKNQSLVEVLQILHYEYGLAYSFSSDIGDDCKLSFAANFTSIEDALQAVLEPCQLDYEQLNDVYIIKQQKIEPINNFFRGRLLDANSGNALPSVVIDFDGQKTLSDEQGYFFVSAPSAELTFSFSHITYQPKDTLLSKDLTHTVKLELKAFELEEVVISRTHKNEYDHFPLVQAWKQGRPKMGYYRNFDEFINNAPSQPWRTYPDKRLHQGTRQRKRGTYHVDFQISRDSAAAMGSIFGFCDGENIYLNLDQPKFKPSTRFVRLRFVGPFAYYTYDVEETYLNFFEHMQEMVIDLNTGEIRRLNTDYLKFLLKQRPDLASEFEQKIFQPIYIDDYFFMLYDEPLTVE